MSIVLRIAVTFGLLASAAQASAETLVVYPAKGQSAEQQSKDEGECQVWARTPTLSLALRRGRAIAVSV
jgi:hypothetical protein